MAIDRSKETERAARLDWLIEETRTKTEATRDSADRVRDRARAVRKAAKAGLQSARERQKRR